MCSSRKPSPGETAAYRCSLVRDFWKALDDDGDPGATTWEALDRLRDKVTAALRRRPPDYGLAESLTAKAALLMTSRGEP